MNYLNTDLKVPLLDAIDKYTIILIKHERAETDQNRQSIANETSFWEGVLDGYRKDGIEVRDEWIQTMKSLNEKLWDVEDAIREEERQKSFGDAFIELARSVYKLNDKRAATKKEINLRSGSAIVEVKSYTPYE